MGAYIIDEDGTAVKCSVNINITAQDSRACYFFWQLTFFCTNTLTQTDTYLKGAAGQAAGVGPVGAL